jgi:hypothetical protein
VLLHTNVGRLVIKGCLVEPKTVVSYIRVSTQKQGRSGLGLEAQREAIVRFAKAEGFVVAGEHVEVETGKGADALERRPSSPPPSRPPVRSSAQSWCPS